MRRFLAVLHARNIEFVRDKSALAWNIALPVFLVFGFSFLFSGDSKDLYKVGVLGDIENTKLEFLQTRYIKIIEVDDTETAINKVKHHQLDMFINLRQGNLYWINSESPNGYMVERILWGTSLDHSAIDKQRQFVSGKPIRYVDWVLPGILAMNMMFSSLFGVGYVIVRYRKNGVLKRLKATPLTAFEFLSAQVISRLLLITTLTILVYIGSDFFIGFYMIGSYWLLLLILLLGSINLISLGLVAASRTSSEEFAGGLLNLISWPMMILSGVWFSLEGAHPAMQEISKLLPVTHIVDAARAVMNDGAGLMDISTQLIFLATTGTVFLVIGAKMFKWES
ncbi:MAG: ABC transporter permease [Thiohalomonadales bacterium]